MPAVPPVSPGPVDEIDSIAELVALASLLQQGAPEAQAACREGVQWLPVGVLMEQLLADLTVVYSLPKVGGTTIAATLARHPAVRPEPIHLHYMSPQGFATLEGQIAGCTHPGVSHFWAQLAQGRGVRALLAANRELRNHGRGALIRKPFLIAGVRDPVALALSAAFETWWLFADRPEGIDTDFIRRWVLRCAPRLLDGWFADELGALFVDVFARPFPAERGWDIHETDAARILVLRQENLARLPEALGALYGLNPESFVVETCNVGERKEYASQYAAVKRDLRLTESDLDLMYSSPAVRHFYTAEEIAGFRRRWSEGKSASESPPTEPAATAKAGPVCGRPAPHTWVCRPCPHCQQQLQMFPGLEHTCDELKAWVAQLQAVVQTGEERIRQLDAEAQAGHERVRQLEAEARAREARRPVKFIARKLRGLARRVARLVRPA